MKQTAIMFMILVGLACNGITPPPVPPPPPPPDRSFDCAGITELATEEILTVDEPVAQEYIVTFKEDAPEMGALSIVKELGTFSATQFGATKQALVTIGTGQTISMALADPRVLFVEENGIKRLDDPLWGEALAVWGQDRIDQRDLPMDGAPFAPRGSGAGIDIFILDTGVDVSHPEFTGRVGDCFSSFGATCNFDSHGHGTHVSGTALGTLYGVAKQSTLHNVQVLSGNSGTDASVIAGIDWTTQYCLENDVDCVGNMSLGGGVSVSLDTAVCRSINAGISWAVAAGNSDTDACDSSPARVRQAVTTVASDRRDRRATFSNYGACSDLIGPGVNILSARRGGGSTTMSGTSMASPHVAGGLALCAEEGADPRTCVIDMASMDKISDVQTGTPNRLLFVATP